MLSKITLLSPAWTDNDQMTLDELKATRQSILAIAGRYGARNLRVFGSVVRGEADAASDVDFLVEEAKRLQVRGTPTFFLGVRNGDTMKVLKRLSGAQPLDRSVQRAGADPQRRIAAIR